MTDLDMNAYLIECVAAYPPVQSVVKELLAGAELMLESNDVRWVRVGEWLEEEADLLATPDPFMPHAQMSTDWLERNKRAVLAIVREYKP